MITVEDEDVLRNNNQYLTGEHDRLIHSYADRQTAFDTSDLDKVVQAGNKKTNLKEIHLLAYIIGAITAESALVPQNSFYINYNDNFVFDDKAHIDRANVQDLSKYVLFAKPNQGDVDRYFALKEEDPNSSLLKKIEFNDFFKVTSDIHENYFYITNMCWPGSVTYVRPDSNEFGFLYFGSGLKNKDIDFLIC